MNIKNSIALIGFMATGKTTIGKLLAKQLEMDFIETDELIIQETEKTIPEIFRDEGEKKFRAYEIKACKEASKKKRTVISCGGGVVLNNRNISNLKQNCIIVLLEASTDEIHRRIIKDTKEIRPLINKNNPKKVIHTILTNRQPLYKQAADIRIYTTNKNPEIIVGEIIEKIKNFQKNM
jgi:shikimate kinase